jgi:tetratricopeptide (TPR) repeat protein
VGWGVAPAASLGQPLNFSKTKFGGPNSAWDSSAVVPIGYTHQNLGNDLLFVGKAEMGDRLAKNTKGLRSGDRTAWSFAQLLDWHFERGTRPGGRIDREGKQWGTKEFAAACGYETDRTVRYWLAGKTLPSDFATVETRLFGTDACYAEWRLELRHAERRDHALKKGVPADIETDDRSADSVAPITNVPVRVPAHFVGRDETLAAIESALDRRRDRVAIVALHGLQGIGKTTLAAAYAERHRRDYQAIWWIRAHSVPLMRADMVALGVRLGWVRADGREEPALATVIREEPALATVMDRLRHQADDFLLIYDNATGPESLDSYMPMGGSAHVIITSNFHAWRGVAELIDVDLWRPEVGADFLTVRTGRHEERDAAEALSTALDGLPLAHEQAAAYCDKLSISLADYLRRFENTPAPLLDRGAPLDHNDGMTVARSFTLGIEEASRLHSGAGPLIAYAAMLAPEPIPLFLFTEAREKLAQPLARTIASDGIDEPIAALLSFALLSRATAVDERDPTFTTDTIRLHRLVREIAADRIASGAKDRMRAVLVEALAALYPRDVFDDPATWPRARLLDEHCRVLTNVDLSPGTGSEEAFSLLLDRLGSYRQGALASYAPARELFERALAIRQQALGPEHPLTATSLHHLARLLRDQGDLAGSQALFERALAIRERVLGREHRATAATINNLASLMQARGNLRGALPLFERALAICETTLGPDHPQTAQSLINVARVMRDQAEFAKAHPFAERGLAIRENVLGPEHPRTAAGLNVLATLLQGQGDLAAARPLFDRALTICEKVLGAEHPYTTTCLTNLALLLQSAGDLDDARTVFERALAVREKVLGPEHPTTATSLNDLGNLFLEQGDSASARPLFDRAFDVLDKALGPNHPATATSLCGIASGLRNDGDIAGAQRLFKRALTIRSNTLGPNHIATEMIRGILAANSR